MGDHYQLGLLQMWPGLGRIQVTSRKNYFGMSCGKLELLIPRVGTDVKARAGIGKCCWPKDFIRTQFWFLCPGSMKPPVEAGPSHVRQWGWIGFTWTADSQLMRVVPGCRVCSIIWHSDQAQQQSLRTQYRSPNQVLAIHYLVFAFR